MFGTQSQVQFDQPDQTSDSLVVVNEEAIAQKRFDPPTLRIMPQKLPVTGLRQSPIDIRTSSQAPQSRKKRSVGEDIPLSINYSAITGAPGLTLENTGHGWKLNIPDEVARKCPVSGGPLGSDEYRLLQVHSHWGKDSSCGSEHTLDGRSFPCEIHLVHWNATKYADPLEAMECTNDGLAVVGTFVQLSADQSSAPLDVVIKGLGQIPYKGDKVPVGNSVELDLNQLVPGRESPKYFNYLGSLTTPPFCESVIWIVLEQPIDAQEAQIAQFRQMNKNDSSTGEFVALVENYREVQQLNDRNIAFFN